MFGIVAQSAVEQTTQTAEATRSEGLLPTLQNIVTGVLTAAPTIVSKYLELKSAKEQAKSIEAMAAQEEAKRAALVAAAQPITTAPTRYPVYGAELGIPSSWPILGIIGIGALLLFRGRGKVRNKKKGRRK